MTVQLKMIRIMLERKITSYLLKPDLAFLPPAIKLQYLISCHLSISGWNLCLTPLQKGTLDCSAYPLPCTV